MAMKIPSQFINTIDDEGDNGGSSEETQEYNFGVPDDYGQEQESDAAGTEPPEVKDNPAWKEVYDLLPAEFHPMIQPKLKSWDDNFAKVQSQYAPYKPLIERGVPYEAINTSMEFANLVNANPRAVWDELGKRYGFSGQGQQQVEEVNPDEDEDATENGLFEPQDLSKNPQFAQLQESYQKLEARLQQEEQQKQAWQEEQAAKAEIDSEWNSIEAKTGKLPQEVKAEIVRRSIFIGDQRGDGNYSLAEGYTDYANFVSKVRNTRANNSAPDVMPGNGGLPKAGKSMGKMDEDEFVDHIAAMAKALAEGNN